jgi:hypothetical protein
MVWAASLELLAAGRVVLALLRRPGAAMGGWLGMAAGPMAG